MRIIRPDHILSTPRKLGKQWGVEVVRINDIDTADWRTDFFMYYPPIDRVRNADASYHELREFYHRSKLSQRQMLSKMGLKVVESYKTHRGAQNLGPAEGYIVRSLQHEAGENYRVTDNRFDFVDGEEYISAVFPKTHEYRVVYVYGKRVLLQKKRPDADMGAKDCWSETDFYIIRDIERSYLTVHTDVFKQLEKNVIVKKSCLIGVDVMYDHKTKDYRICEFNVCPSLLLGLKEDGVYARNKVIEAAEARNG